jgi:ATP-dependent helicase HrpB
MRQFASPLPIDAALAPLREALARPSNAVLVAPPGAGKTTRVPLALLDEPWVGGGRIILLEPRRLAARAAAEHMAALLGEPVGATVGLRVRLESRVSAATRIEVVTEGVFARRILDDPALDGVAAVLFDEFHERSLDADLGLALALDAQAGLREDLRCLAMSATLDGARVAKIMGDAPVIRSEGRAFPVETRYVPRDPAERIEDSVVRVIRRALDSDSGSVLAFLPGQGEIERTASLLAARVDSRIVIAPLYGALDRAAQDRAIRPAGKDVRKIVLASAIAETSLTIEGVRIVVDSGLARVPRYEPDVGLTRLETMRASRASADQRRGRAGRTEPGVCYRLWDEAATGALEPFAPPEILSSDLAGLVLDLAQWGVRTRTGLAWLDPPPAAAWDEARVLLRALGAIDGEGAITDEGRALRALALPPRLARMVVDAARSGQADDAATIALLLSERGLGGGSTDLATRRDMFARDRSPRANAGRGLARQWARAASRAVGPTDAAGDLSTGALLAFAFPELVAKARGDHGTFLMANGRAAALEPHDPLAARPYLAVAEVSGRASRARILAAAEIGAEEIAAHPALAVEEQDETRFDPASASLRRRITRRLGAITLAERTLPVVADAAAAAMLAANLVRTGVSHLPWTKEQARRRARIGFLRALGDQSWPDVSDAALAAAGGWLALFVVGRVSRGDIAADDLEAALAALVPYDLQRRLEREAPEHFTTPAGSTLPIDYDAEGGPALDVRVQELFGLAEHPAVAGGRLPLTLRLLSPAHRPIQVTRDLPGFWRGSWAAVRADMRGRYPRHPWPDDPANAPPTRRAKPRSQ